MKTKHMMMIAIALTAVGCAQSHTLPRGDRGTGSVSTPLADSAWMAGEMVTIGAFDADAFEISADEYTVTLHVIEERGWAMAALSVGEEMSDLEPGTHLDTDQGDPLSVTGCSGPTQWDYTWDGGADRIVVDVEQGELAGDRLVTFEIDYPGGQHVEGGFVYHAL
jgi:hypothetical protein